MPGKIAGSDPRPSVRVTRGAGSGQHLASVLQEGRENANMDAGLGSIWRISIESGPRERDRANRRDRTSISSHPLERRPGSTPVGGELAIPVSLAIYAAPSLNRQRLFLFILAIQGLFPRLYDGWSLPAVVTDRIGRLSVLFQSVCTAVLPAERRLSPVLCAPRPFLVVALHALHDHGAQHLRSRTAHMASPAGSAETHYVRSRDRRPDEPEDHRNAPLSQC